MTDADTATHSIVIERVMPHPPEKVWRALTQGSLIEAWLMKNDFQPVVGHRFNLRSNPMPHWNGVVDCEVLVVEPQCAALLSLECFGRRGGDGDQDHRHLDADAGERRRPCAHGAVGLPGGTRLQLPGCEVWLAEIFCALERVAAGL